MARARIPVPEAAAIKNLADKTGCIVVRAVPNAASDAVLLPEDDGSVILTVRTTAKPEDGKANEAILRLLAKALGKPMWSIDLVRGSKARTKLVHIRWERGS